MSVPKNIYVGKRYVPKLFVNPNDGSANWINTVQFESLTVVLWQGASYTSKQDVPIGIDIGNIKYWVRSADYNAQVAIYEQNVRDYHQYVIDQIGIINDSYDAFKNDVNDEFNSLSININKGIKDYVNIIEYGAKLDGITDDSLAFENALKDGNVYIPSRAIIFIGSTININNPQRIIDFNESVIIGGNGVTMFQIGTLDMTASLLNITLKNAFVNLSNSASFLQSFNSYFINFENIRITGLKDSNYGIKIVNGFNISFNKVHIGGTNSGVSNISGNNASGIIISTNGTVNTNVIGTTNITNVSIDNCLIQHVKYGIYYNNVGNTTYDTNTMSNLGFSYVDNVIVTNENNCINQKISVLRAEYCGTLFANNGDISVEDVYCYNTLYCFDNGANGRILIKSKLYHWNPITTGGYLIKNNLGTLNFKDCAYYNRTPSVTLNQGTLGRIIQKRGSSVSVANGQTSLGVDAIEIQVYDQQTYIDFANITGNEGSEFYIFSSTGANFLLPNGTYHYNSDLGNMLLHCIIISGVAQIIGQRTDISCSTQNVNALAITKQKISIVNTQQSINTFSFNNVGITILYSTTAGVTLTNGNANIINFANINSNNPIDLYNNPIILIPTNDGSGKGFAIKS
jgi:hypothetical protein